MSPNLFLLAKKATTPWTWHPFHEKKPKLHFAKDPVPGIYATTHDGKRYLVAIKPNNRKEIDVVFSNDRHESPRTRLARKSFSSPDLTTLTTSKEESGDSQLTRIGSRSLGSLDLLSASHGIANLRDPFSDDYEISDSEADSMSSTITSPSERSEEKLPKTAIAYSGCESSCCSEGLYSSYAEPRFSHDGINEDEDEEALLFSKKSFSGGNNLTKDYGNYASPRSGRSLRFGEPASSTELRNMHSQSTSPFNTAAYARFYTSNPASTTSSYSGQSPRSSRNQSQVEIGTPFTTPSTTSLNYGTQPQLLRTEQQSRVPNQYRFYSDVHPDCDNKCPIRPQLKAQNTSLSLRSYLALSKVPKHTLTAIDLPGYKSVTPSLRTLFSKPHNRWLFKTHYKSLIRDLPPCSEFSHSYPGHDLTGISWHPESESKRWRLKWIQLDDGFSYVGVEYYVLMKGSERSRWKSCRKSSELEMRVKKRREKKGIEGEVLFCVQEGDGGEAMRPQTSQEQEVSRDLIGRRLAEEMRREMEERRKGGGG